MINFSHKIIGNSPGFRNAVLLAKKVAKSSSNIFISGESGTGKEVITHLIHNESKRHNGPFVVINCSAIPEALLESELFGHTKGAFTGAEIKKVGMFEEAQNGTLFLDEIADLSLCLQAKILRVIQEKKIKRVGENHYRSINCQIISATHKDLAREVEDKNFREDLFYRLNVIPIYIPPLRERVEDILPLAESFLEHFSSCYGPKECSFSAEAIDYILGNSWPGNVRELENTIERAVILAENKILTVKDLTPIERKATARKHCSEEGHFLISTAESLPLLEDVIQQYVEYAVHHNGGARDKTAKDIGIDRKTLSKRMKLRVSP